MLRKFKRDRNIKSNALKLFLKHLRKDLTLKDGYLKKLISKVSQDDPGSVQKFEHQLD